MKSKKFKNRKPAGLSLYFQKHYEKTREKVLLDTPCVKCGVPMRDHKFNIKATKADEAFECPEKESKRWE